MDRLTVGPGSNSSSQMGPLANRRRLQAVQALLDNATSVGAKVLAGGQRQGTQGNFMRPTVLVDTPPHAQALHSEPFAPVALVGRFTSLEDGLAQANNSPYGLAAYAFTRSAATAVAVGEGLEAGGIGINSFAVSHIEAPFGGLKDSGYGHEGGSEGMEAYMHQKYIHHA
jgi:succinate-semialdehyde dehydrogenase/glutarate-semialdehyde dehydrogenase